MAKYTIRYVDYAKDQIKDLKGSIRRAFESRIADLERNPMAVGDLGSDGSYTTWFNDGRSEGVIWYLVTEKYVTVTVIRVNWVK